MAYVIEERLKYCSKTVRRRHQPSDPTPTVGAPLDDGNKYRKLLHFKCK